MDDTEPDFLNFGLYEKAREYGFSDKDAAGLAEAVTERIEKGNYESLDEVLNDLETVLREDSMGIIGFSTPNSQDPDEVSQELYEVAKNTLESDDVPLHSRYGLS